MNITLNKLTSLILFVLTLMSVFTSNTSARESRIVEQGQDFARHRVVTFMTNSQNAVVAVTNEFTVLENALYYRDGESWRESEDVIESFPGGANIFVAV